MVRNFDGKNGRDRRKLTPSRLSAINCYAVVYVVSLVALLQRWGYRTEDVWAALATDRSAVDGKFHFYQ